MRNYKMTIAYDGSRYQGWQKQKHTKETIQEVLEETIRHLTAHDVDVVGSGRTDAGVHAWGQVANVKIPTVMDVTVLLKQINELLPEDIRIRSVERVPNQFHSRFQAKEKRYVYTVEQGEKPSVFTRKYCYHYPKKLNMEAMKEAANVLIGTHDFRGFTDYREEKSTVRTIYEIQIKQTGTLLQCSFRGDGFLYHMIRIIMGSLLEVGEGRMTIQDMEQILKGKNREKAGFLAPASGLCLVELKY